MKIVTIKEKTPEAQNHDIPEVGKTTKTFTIVERPSTHKYNTISRNKRVNHVITFKNSPNFIFD